ncbi:MAG TPA: oxidoreductase [Flavobacterium sp.]|nr:oxidoreductase [Flavobacterium sp.]
MKLLITIPFVLLLVWSGIDETTSSAYNVIHNRVEIDTLITGDINIRAILLDGDFLYYGGDKSRLGMYNISTKEHKRLQYDKDIVDFRSIGKTNDHVFVLSAGSPAILVRVEKSGRYPTLVLEDRNPKIFYDSMKFWNAKEGIAVGDPINGCFKVLITRDGGMKWKEITCRLPPALEGEGAFAASNTNIVTKLDKTWIVTGGKKSRVYYSPDRGLTWAVTDTPIIGGEASTGIYSADFYDNKLGFVTGGNYLKPELNSANKAITTDGGVTWKLVADNSGFGYASCVQFVPGSEGKQLVTVGPSGLYYSGDSGETWRQLLNDDSLHTIRFKNSHTAYAAGKNKIVRIRFYE